MFSIEKQVDIVGSRQVLARAEHSARMTLAEKGGRAIMRVLAKDARISAVSAVATGVDVEVSGKMILSAVCEIAGGEVVCLEYAGNFNFAHKAAGVGVPSVCDAKGIVSAVRVLRASGCEVVCEVEFEVVENFAVAASEACVVSAADCYSEVRALKSVSGVLKVHDFVCGAEMEIDAAVAIVLSQQFYVECSGVSARGGSVACSGNVHGWISYIDINGVVARKACSFPFREEFSCEGADDFAAFARAGECNVVCEVNEVRAATVVACEVEVEISLWGYKAVAFECGSSFFSDKLEIAEEAGEFVCSDFAGLLTASGKFSAFVEWPFDLPSAASVVAARVASIGAKAGAQVGGDIVCCICGGAEMKFQEFSVPYTIDFPVMADGKMGGCDVVISEIEASVSGGKIEIIGRVCGNLAVVSDRKECVVSSLFAGAEKENISGGFVLYRAEDGESLLDVCAAVGVMPTVLKAQNPSVTFPIAGERKVVVWKGGV